MKTRICLLIAFHISACYAVAVSDLSSTWLIGFELEGGNDVGPLAGGSVASISEAGSTLCGRSTLGGRNDGFLIGLAEGRSIDIAITFRRSPVIFVRLVGGFDAGEMRGRFSAYSSDGDFWMGNFSARRAGPGEGRASYAEDADLAPKPTVFIDPEAIWSEQQGKERRDAFDIYYSRDTVLMCRNKPMIWQWWL
ncbi:hypothetical protein P0O24_10460 [Methanotrichaceae archaeon M04Ac]|uniref:Uncharacterized protein n=1 Tax=Candidatus Methanocrinis alkalitolerans TaxID=3033395 RepID=A0ABT5XH59_9EURY|nr:hypothetical protein [Candidatus Methanocrinis alkalitolerans]MDF0594002.1 hypothetical protein [Candidatus Methanocrinis alkalitolerans]